MILLLSSARQHELQMREHLPGVGVVAIELEPTQPEDSESETQHKRRNPGLDAGDT